VKKRLDFQRGKQKELLIKFKNKYKFSRNDFSKTIDTKRETIKNWVSERHKLPEKIFKRIIEIVKTSKISSIKKFYKIGGFVQGVKISSKSKYYKGLEKNQLLSKIMSP
jgi:hypothetical protein